MRLLCIVLTTILFVFGIALAEPVDSDNDGLLDFEENMLGTNPLIPDSDIDSDNDGFSNLGEKQNSLMTDPLNPESHPGDENMVMNPGAFWPDPSSLSEPTSEHLPAGWLKYAHNPERGNILSWANADSVGRNSFVLKSESNQEENRSWFGWIQNIVPIKPDTWHEFSVWFTTEGIVPSINPQTQQMQGGNHYIGAANKGYGYRR